MHWLTYIFKYPCVLLNASKNLQENIHKHLYNKFSPFSHIAVLQRNIYYNNSYPINTPTFTNMEQKFSVLVLFENEFGDKNVLVGLLTFGV